MCQTLCETVEYMTVFSKGFQFRVGEREISKKTNLIVSWSDRSMRGLKKGNGIGSSQD